MKTPDAACAPDERHVRTVIWAGLKCLHPAWAVLIGFIVLSALMTRPLLAYFTTHVPGWVWGDNAEYLWKIWWTKHALIDQAVSLFQAPHIFYPTGYSLAGGEMTVGQIWPVLPVALAFGAPAAYNLVAMASFVLSGFTAYLLVTWLTGNRWSGLLVGVVFAYLPFRYQQFGNHLPLLGTQWMPLVFLYLERTLRTRRPRDAALLGLFFAWNALCSWYFAAIVGLLAVTYAGLRLGARRHDRLFAGSVSGRQWLLCVAAGGAVVLALVGPVAIPYLQARVAGDGVQPLSEADTWSASPTDYLVPNPLHPLWGHFVVRHLVPTNELWRAFEFTLSWGFGASLLALYGMRRSPTPLTRAVAWTALAAVVLSLGITLHVHGRALRIPAPPEIVQGFNSVMSWLTQSASPLHIPYDLADSGHIAVPLPALLLHLFVPPFAGIRVWSRFGVLAALMVGVLAGIGLATWQREQRLAAASGKGRRGALTAGSLFFVGLALFESVTIPFGMVDPAPRPVDAWLSRQPGSFAVIQLPYEAALSGPQLYYSQYHRQAVAGGYGTFFPPAFTRHEDDLRAFPADRAVDVLAGWEVRYVLLEPAGFSDWAHLRSQIDAQPRLRLAYADAGIVVYEMVKP